MSTEFTSIKWVIFPAMPIFFSQQNIQTCSRNVPFIVSLVTHFLKYRKISQGNEIILVIIFRIKALGC